MVWRRRSKGRWRRRKGLRHRHEYLYSSWRVTGEPYVYQEVRFRLRSPDAVAEGCDRCRRGGTRTALADDRARAADNITKAYPDELLHIDAYTKGKIKPGDVLTADNVDVVKDLLDPVAYKQVKTMGRKINIVASTTDVTKLFSHDYLEATLRNKGRAILGADGNIYDQAGRYAVDRGQPVPRSEGWRRGHGEFDPELGAARLLPVRGPATTTFHPRAMSATSTISSGRNSTPTRVSTARSGTTSKDLLRYQSVVFTSPQDTAGTAFPQYLVLRSA